MDETVKVKTSLTLQEYRKIRYRKDWWLVPISVALMVQFILIAPGMINSIATGAVSDDSWFAFGMAFLCFFIVPIFAIIRFFMLPAFIYRKNSFLEEGSEYLFTPQHIEWHSSIGDDTMYWAKVHHIRETADFYLIYVTRRSSMIINKHGFEGDAETKFRKMLEEKIPQKKLKLLKKN